MLLIIPDHHSNKSIITGKLFEYLASARPILCIGPPDGDAADIIETAGNGKCAAYNDMEGIIRLLTSFIKRNPFCEKCTSGVQQGKPDGKTCYAFLILFLPEQAHILGIIIKKVLIDDQMIK